MIARCYQTDTCALPIAYIDSKGWTLCAEHGTCGDRRRRKLRPFEIIRLMRGDPLPHYEPMTKAELERWEAERKVSEARADGDA